MCDCLLLCVWLMSGEGVLDVLIVLVVLLGMWCDVVGVLM